MSEVWALKKNPFLAMGCREEGKFQREGLFPYQLWPSGLLVEESECCGVFVECTRAEKPSKTPLLCAICCESDMPSSITESLASGMANKSHSFMVHAKDKFSA